MSTPEPDPSFSGYPVSPPAVLAAMFLREGAPRPFDREPPAPETERDEPLPDGVDALIDLLTARTVEVVRLNREVARLDAAVTAVRDLAEFIGDNYASQAILRALDGGES